MTNLEKVHKALIPNVGILINLAQSLRQSPGVVSVCCELSIHQYESGEVIEAYVEAELINDTAVTWWLDIRLNADLFEFDARILGTDADGQFTFKRLPATLAHGVADAPKVFWEKVMDAKHMTWYVEKWAKEYAKYKAFLARKVPCTVSTTTFVYSKLDTTVDDYVPPAQISRKTLLGIKSTPRVDREYVAA